MHSKDRPLGGPGDDNEARTLLWRTGRFLSFRIRECNDALAQIEEQERIEKLVTIDAEVEVPAANGKPARMRRLANNVSALVRLGQRIASLLYRILVTTNPNLRRLKTA